MTGHSITFAARGDRMVAVSGYRPGSTTVYDIPPGAAPRVMLKISRVVFWPVPKDIRFADLMALRDGQVVRGDISGPSA